MRPNLITRLLILIVIIDVSAMIGCHRSYYRRAADAEARRLILEKASDPRWDSATGNIAVDPYSRMFNPFSSDHPPIPPDDATSHQLMHRVDKKDGYPHWHANGDTNFVESPEWRSYLPVNEQGQLVLNLDRAFQLALLHSPDLQQQTETLYLSALDVSLERFGFDTQLFTGFNSFFSTQGRFRNASGRSQTQLASSIGANGQGLQLQRLGTTGANYAVGIANTILFNFSGNNTQSATSLIDFSVIQPLLRGGGRDRVMESLTQTERTLLANVRQMDRFRRGFYLQVATGRNPGTGVLRGGNFLGLPGGANIGIGGFYGLLLQQQQIRNQEFNVRQLEAVLEQFRELFERDQLDAVQLKLFESTVYGQQSNLVQLRIGYQSSVDQFIQSIGLPPDLDVLIQDDFLDQFNLISNEINDQLIGLGKLREETGNELNKVVDLLPSRSDLVEDSDFEWSDELEKRLQAMIPFIESATETLEEIKGNDVDSVIADLEKMDTLRASRIAYLKKLATAIDSGEVISGVDRQLYAPESIPKIDELRETLDDPDNPNSIVKNLAEVSAGLAETKAKIESLPQEQAKLTKKELFTTIKDDVQNRIPKLLNQMNNSLLELSLLQAQARSNSIEIYDVQIDSETAIEVARCMRRDWMNARASLVDSWRRIEFIADQLESQLDLVFQGDIGNVGDNPLRLRYETGQLRAGFRFDSPLVRLAERNQYRQILIVYQQARRQLYQFEDEVKRNLRNILRTLERDKVLFELNRRAVLVQIELIESSRLELERPAPFVAGGGGGSSLGSSTARNLADAFNNLNQVQNQFVRNWVEYEVLRRGLDFDMGTMQIDQIGAWIDPGLIDNSIGVRAAAALGVTLDCQFCSDLVTNPIVNVEPVDDEESETLEPPSRIRSSEPSSTTEPKQKTSAGTDREKSSRATEPKNSDTSNLPNRQSDSTKLSEDVPQPSQSKRQSEPLKPLNQPPQVDSSLIPLSNPGDAPPLPQPLQPQRQLQQTLPPAEQPQLELKIEAPTRPDTDGTQFLSPRSNSNRMNQAGNVATPLVGQAGVSIAAPSRPPAKTNPPAIITATFERPLDNVERFHSNRVSKILTGNEAIEMLPPLKK